MALWAFCLLHSPPFPKGLIVRRNGLKLFRGVVAVMLPPMAIFFPLFTLLEDFGYLPRVAFNMDRFFAKSGTSGKQSLTMLMGFGCNACGVTGCRIIESPRERIIATVTNNFVPCNGRFPISNCNNYYVFLRRNFITISIHLFQRVYYWQ